MNTPVDFLKLRIQALILTKISQSDRDIIEHYYKQAKELEKQQIIEANETGWYDAKDYYIENNAADNIAPPPVGEYYYNETFKIE